MRFNVSYEKPLLELYPNKIITNLTSHSIYYSMWQNFGSIKDVEKYVSSLGFTLVKRSHSCSSIGVHISKGKYIASSYTSTDNHISKTIGTFKEEDEASIAYNVYNILNNIGLRLNSLPITQKEQIEIYTTVIVPKYGTATNYTHSIGRQGLPRNISLGKPKTSKYVGVCYDKSRNKWVCSIWKDKKCVHRKRWDTENQAAVDYNINVFIHYGKYAKLNVIE